MQKNSLEHLFQDSKIISDVSRAILENVPLGLDNYFSDRYVENCIPIFLKNRKTLIAGIFCFNLPKLNHYPKDKPNFYIDIRIWEYAPDFSVARPTKQGCMIPLESIDQLIERLEYLKNKYKSISSLDELADLFSY